MLTELKCFDKVKKKTTLLQILQSIFEHNRYKIEIEKLLKKLDLSKQQIIDEFLYYNLDLNLRRGNDIYNFLQSRVVLYIHNLIEGSWHIERQNTVVDFIKKVNPKRIVDVGFGVPSKYVRDCVLKQQDVNLTLVDFSDTAFEFVATLLTQWDNSWQSKIHFKKMDINYNELVECYDLYILQDIVEHAYHPAEFLSTQIKASSFSSFFFISLPIGQFIPKEHYHAWFSDKEAIEWICSCGLKIMEHKSVYVNPKIDLFAEQLGIDYHDFYALCSRKD